jgi:hypothetical protein
LKNHQDVVVVGDDGEWRNAFLGIRLSAEFVGDSKSRIGHSEDLTLMPPIFNQITTL